MIVYLNDIILFTKLPLIKQAFKYYVKFVSTLYNYLTCNKNYNLSQINYRLILTICRLPILLPEYTGKSTDFFPSGLRNPKKVI